MREPAGVQGPEAPPEWRYTIGIVGGLGPHAHIELERELLAATARLLGRPPRDQDYPPWLLCSLPATPDRTLALLGQGPSPLPALERALHTLGSAPAGLQADFALLACLTAHAYLDALRQRTAMPLLDLVEETLRVAVQDWGARRVGLLASTGTLRAGLYPHAAGRLGADLSIVSLLDAGDSTQSGEWLQERLVMETVYGPLQGVDRLGGGLKSGLVDGPAGEAHVLRLQEAIRHLRSMGAELVILGCTELPLVLRQPELGGLPLLNPLRIGAAAAVDIAAGRRPLPSAALAGAACS